ncbi:MAG: amidohydrolase [Lysobacterales bacterium]
MDPLRVSLVQGATRWHDAVGNRDYYGELIRPLAGATDLVVLPETFTSGFSNEVDAVAEDMAGPSMQWLADQASSLAAVVTGSVVIAENGRMLNRMIWMRPDGSFDSYDKRHLFRMSGEHERYDAGNERLVVGLRGWRVLPQVCYDLRFPVWLRNRFDPETDTAEYDLALFIANWPAPRREPWRTLLRARAIENLAYVVGVNRVGPDGNGLDYAGDSCAIDPVGQPLIELSGVEQVATVTLDPQRLGDHRRRFPAHLDADAFQLLEGAG